MTTITTPPPPRLPPTPSLQSIIPFVRRLKIVDKNTRELELGKVLNYPQYRLLQEVDDMLRSKVPVRVIVLKARQMGISTIVNAIQFTMAFLKPRMKGLIVAHELDASEHLLSMVNFYWESFHFHRLFEQKNKSAKHLSWDQINSAIKVSTAKNVGSGRSQTLHFLHASEVAFWEDGKTLMTGLQQSIPESPMTFVFQESTANGVGNYFHSQWLAASAGDIDVKPLFFPWWQFPGYRAEYVRLSPTLDSPKDEEERILYAALCKVMSRDEAESRLVWRRYAIKNKSQNSLDVFHQEYPSTPEEAFLSTGRNIFPKNKIDECYDPTKYLIGDVVFDGPPGAMMPGTPTKFLAHSEGKIKMFKRPSRECSYVVVGDPTRTTFGDYAVIQVLNRHTWEQVAVWRAKMDPLSFGDEMLKLALHYNDALINVETNGPGLGTIGRITASNYPYVWFRQEADKQTGTLQKNYGWHSSSRRKPEMIGYLLNAFVENDILIHDPVTYAELINYVIQENGDYGPADKTDGHDDCVTSLAIAIATIRYEMPSLPPPGTMPKPTTGEQVHDLVNQYYESGGTMDVDEEMMWGDDE